MPRTRYDNIRTALDAIPRGTHLQFLEVGTYDGVRAQGVLAYWRESGGVSVTYHGFDLFEDLTPEMSKVELSKSRLPPAMRVVGDRLRKSGFACNLYKGNTRDTLPAVAPTLPKMDFIFVDGGHTLDTIASDWASVRTLMHERTLVLFDDYYENRDDYGCKRLITGLSRDEYAVRLLDPVDDGADGLRIRMVLVQRRP